MSIFYDKIIAQWEHNIHVMTFDEGIGCHSTRILHRAVGFSLQKAT